MAIRLDDLIDATRDRLDRVKRERPLAELERAIEQRTTLEGRPFSEALSRPWTSVIAEYKRRSPSAGDIRAGRERGRRRAGLRPRRRGGLSILTEERHFGGSLDDLRDARDATDLPILRKDFTIDPYQLYEAKAYGADAVLLVVGSLKVRDLAELHEIADDLDLDAIVEVHNEEELEARSRSTATWSGSTTATSRTSRSRSRRRTSCSPTSPPARPSSRVRDPEPRADRGAGARGRRRRPDRRDRDAGARPRGGRRELSGLGGADAA